MARIAVYLLCVLTSMLCAALLIRAYRTTRTGLLLWSSVAFATLAFSNIILFVDLIIVPTIDLELLRTLVALGGMLVLVAGLMRSEP